MSNTSRTMEISAIEIVTILAAHGAA